MLRTMVIGVAGRGQHWIRAVANHSQFQLAALADLNPELLAKSGQDFNVPLDRQFTDFHVPLQRGEIDVVVNAAATTAHFAITRDVLSAGAHSLVEKPFTLDMSQAEQLVALAAQKKLTLSIGQNYRYTPMCRFIAAAIAARRLGDLIEVTGRFHRHRPPRPSDIRVAHPMLFIQGVHHLDWLLSVLPGPITLERALNFLPPDSQWPSPTVSHLLLSAAGGLPVSYSGSYDARGEISSFAGKWRFAFQRGDLLTDDQDQVWQITPARDPKSPEIRELIFPAGSPAPAPTSEALLLDDLHTGITTGAEPPTSGARNLPVLKLLFEIAGIGLAK